MHVRAVHPQRPPSRQADSRTYQQQLDVLSQKARAGSRTPAERAELDEFIRVADLLAILQSRARQALKRADLAT